MADKLLAVQNLRVSFPYGKARREVVRGVDLEVNQGEIIALLGESGSGKSVTAMSILGLTELDGGQIEDGDIYYQGQNVLALPDEKKRQLRGKEIAYIFQNPAEALNPYRRAGKQVEEALRAHGLPASKELILQALKDVGLDKAETVFEMYPSQLSGGQCQRVMIAMSLVCRPKLIIADESTSAIDASLQRKVLTLLRDINEKYGASLIVITHDFDVAKHLCDKVVVMYGGLVMEEGRLDEVLANPRHPYTAELLNCASSLDRADARLYTLEGRAPSPMEFKEECPFYARCRHRAQVCAAGIPALQEISAGRKARCARLGEIEVQVIR